MEDKKSARLARKKEYDNKYRREKKLSIAFRLSRAYEADLIDIYESIPNKMEWFRWALLEYDKRRKTQAERDSVPKNVPKNDGE